MCVVGFYKSAADVFLLLFFFGLIQRAMVFGCFLVGFLVNSLFFDVFWLVFWLPHVCCYCFWCFFGNFVVCCLIFGGLLGAWDVGFFMPPGCMLSCETKENWVGHEVNGKEAVLVTRRFVWFWGVEVRCEKSWDVLGFLDFFRIFSVGFYGFLFGVCDFIKFV